MSEQWIQLPADEAVQVWGNHASYYWRCLLGDGQCSATGHGTTSQLARRAGLMHLRTEHRAEWKLSTPDFDAPSATHIP